MIEIYLKKLRREAKEKEVERKAEVFRKEQIEEKKMKQV
jgi:hypothetical protein